MASDDNVQKLIEEARQQEIEANSKENEAIAKIFYEKGKKKVFFKIKNVLNSLF